MKDKKLHRSVLWSRLKFILGRLAVVIFVFFLLINTLLPTALVQSKLAHIASDYLSEQLNIKITINRVKISLMMDVTLQGVIIEDAHRNEMITIQYFYARLGSSQLSKNIFVLNEVEMLEGGFSLRKYKGETVFNYTDLFGLPDSTTEKSKDLGFELYCKKIKLTRCYFDLIDENKPAREGFDWNHMRLKLQKVEGRNVAVNNDIISADIRDIIVSDTSSFNIKKFTSSMKFAPDGWYFDDTFILTPTSVLDFDLKMGYSSFDYIGDFVDSITISADLRPSILDVSDIAFFTESLKPYNFIADIETKFEGSLRDFLVKDFRMEFGSNTVLSMNARLQGILDYETARIDVDIKELTTQWNDLLLLDLPVGDKPPLSILSEPISTTLSFSGGLSDFETDIVLKTTVGDIEALLQMHKPNPKALYSYKGSLYSSSIDVGALTDASNILGKGAFKLDFSGSGTDMNTATIDVNAVIDSLYIMQHKYEQIQINGLFQELKFNGDLSVFDKYIHLDFHGLMDFKDSLPTFNFQADLNDVYLAKLNLYKHLSDDLRLSTKLNIKARGNSIDNILGYINVSDFEVIEADSVYAFNSLQIITYQTDTTIRNIRIRSDLLNASISGNYHLNYLPEAFNQILGNYLTAIRSDTISSFNLSYNLNWDLQIKNISPVTRFFVPSLKIPNGLSLSQQLNLEDEKMIIKSDAPTIIFGNTVFSDFQLLAETHSYGTSMNLGIGNVVFSQEADSSGIGMNDLELNALIQNDTLRYSLSWDRMVTSAVDISYVDGIIDFGDFPNFAMNLTDMSIVLRDNDSEWNVLSNNTIYYDSTQIKIDSLRFYTGNSFLEFNGSISNDSSSIAQMNIGNLDLSMADKILEGMGLNLHGKLSGSVQLFDPYNNLSVKSNLTIDTLKVNQNNLGVTHLKLDWDNKKKAAFIDLNTTIETVRNVSHPIAARGHYFLNNTNENLNLDVSFENFNISVVNPFVQDFVSDVDGYLSGKMTAHGTISAPDIKGNFSLQRGAARILYLGTLYHLAGDISIDKKMFAFNNFILRDTLSNQALLEGGIRHNMLKDFSLDVKLKPQKFLLLNVSRYENETFYGVAKVTGDVTITGPFNNINISAKVATDKDTDVSVPLNLMESVEQSSFVIFKTPVDSAATEEKKDLVSSSSGLSMNLNVGMTPDAQIRIFLPDDLGKITATGKGDISLKLDEYNNFTLDGIYTIEKGDFYLTLQLLLNKHLILRKGSTINFSGDPMDADVNISAYYELQTTLANLNLPLDSARAQKHIPVNCVINMREKLANPEISFSVEFPSLHDDTKSLIYSKLDTTNDAEMTQQAFSLLLLNSFSTDDYSGIGRTTAVSTGANMLTNQLNNWLSQMIKGVDLGVIYRPDDEVSSETFEVYYRQAFFNNRVTVDVNVGTMSDAENTSNRSTVLVGDIMVEYKLTEDGRWDMQFFSRSNANDISKIGTSNEYGYTYGVGITFHKSFHKLKDIAIQHRENREQRKQKKEAKKNPEAALRKDDE